MKDPCEGFFTDHIILYDPYYMAHYYYYSFITRKNYIICVHVTLIKQGEIKSQTVTIRNPFQDKKWVRISTPNRTNRSNRQRQILLVGTNSK